MFIFGSEIPFLGLSYKTHAALPGLNIVIELNIPSSFPTEVDRFNWWSNLFGK